MSHNNPRSKYFILNILFGCLIITSACNFSPPEETSVPGEIETAAAATIASSLQQQTIEALEGLLTAQALTLQAPTVTLAPTQPFTETPTTPPPTLTQIPTSIPPTSPPPSPQPLMVTANVETRCRQGPSTAFPTISYILVGQQAEVIGRNPEDTWWLIRDPQNKFGNCWVWGETTQLLGDESKVPVVQPPPLPTPVTQVNFEASYANIHICGGVATVIFQVRNTGTVEFRSSNITIRDVTNDVGLAGPESSNNPFMPNQNSCPPGFSELPDGSTAFVGKGMGILPPSGTKGRGIIVLCTLPNLGGQCLEKRANFTFP